MNQHLGATYSLSVLIVVAFAVAFYRADPPPKKEVSAGAETSRKNRVDSTTLSPPAPVKTVSALTPVVTPEPTSVKAARVGYPAKTQEKSVVRPVSRVRQVASPSPRSAFTTVIEQERLADVSVRIYGTTEASERLWKANRDQLTSITSELRAGMMLRTP